jgi:hypothetical protein
MAASMEMSEVPVLGEVVRSAISAHGSVPDRARNLAIWSCLNEDTQWWELVATFEDENGLQCQVTKRVIKNGEMVGKRASMHRIDKALEEIICEIIKWSIGE